MATIRIEAESMNRSVYRLESNSAFNASNGTVVSLNGGGSNTETGTISTLFNGASGTYDISVTYLDENDGASNYSLTVGNSAPYTWIGDDLPQPGAGNFFSAQVVIPNVTIQNGDLISITGSEDGGEPARIDYIEITGDGLQPPAWAGSNGIIELMPLGDSITRGADPTVPFGQQNGYRDNLQTLLGSTGLNFDFVGSLTHGQSGFDRNHEGHGGWTISEISADVNGWLDSFQPEIVLLKIGTNDIGFSPTGQQGGELSIQAVIDQLSSLIDQIFTRVPATRIVVSSIAPAVFDDIDPNLFGLLPNFEQRVQAFNALIPDLVAAKITQGKLVSFADSFGALDPAQHISSDGVHPNESGYAQIAGVFNTAIQNLLSTPPDDTENMTAFPASFDLSSLATGDGSDGFVINGVNSYDQSGFSVSDAGDINGDGFDDIVIGILNETYGSNTEGYVIFGSSNSFGASLDLAALNSPGGPSGLILLGDGNVGFGDKTSVSAAGDINGDGVDDLIIGKSGDSPYATYNAGQSYVIFGQSAGFSNTSIDLTSLDGTNGGLIISGVNDYDASGFSVSSAGDVNGDGIDDLIIGAPYAQSNSGYSAGKTYVVFGSTTDLDENLDLSILDGSNGFILNGIDANNNNDLSGSAVSSAGDVNGDGIDDLIVSAKQAAPDNDTYAGETYVIFGTATPFASEQVNLADLNTTGGPSGFLLKGTDPFDYSGTSVSAAGDINGDGIDDIIVGAPYTAGPNGNDGAGKSYVIFGNTSFSSTYELADVGVAGGPDGFIINGADTGDSSGISVSGAGDINGDGIDDLIIGARDADSNDTGNTGASYVIYGKTTPFSSTLNLSTVDGASSFAINGIDAYDYSGLSVSSAGDINGDGIDDVIVGARYADPGEPANNNAGESYIVFGRPEVTDNLPTPGSDNLIGTASGELIDALAGDDNVFGLDGNDTLRGRDGNDVLDGGKDSDTILGENDNDLLRGGGGDDTLEGGDGNDKLYGNSDNDRLSGANGNDTLFGNDGDDLLRGQNDDDILYGGNGNDSLNGGSGNDTLEGGFGNDTLNGNVGNDVLNGNDGVDTLYGYFGDDTLYGGDDNDQLFGSLGVDVLYGEAGNDNLNGGDDNDILYGGDDNDILSGSDGNDSLFGGSNDDTLYGGIGDDTLSGDEGNDLLYGFTGDDSLIGGIGNDSLFGFTGADTLEGGDGDDLIDSGADDDLLSGENGNDILDGFTGNDSIVGGQGDDILKGRNGNDTLNGGDDNDMLFGDDGNDSLIGGAGNDSLFGQGGNDVLTGGDNSDTINGNDGDDLISGDTGDDTLQGATGDDTLNGGLGNDTLNGGAQNDNLNGGAGNDTLNGNIGDDSLFGDEGIDTIYGYFGNDTLNGGKDNDSLFGSSGNDSLFGGDGNDNLSGGDDNDSLFGGEGDDILGGNQGDDVLFGNMGNDTLNGSFGNDSLSGNTGSDVLFGFVGNDVINGDEGDDFLDGNDGNDTLTGGLGNDTLVGGSPNGNSAAQIDSLSGGDGNDTFVLKNMYAGFGDDDYALILDFSKIDDSIVLENFSHNILNTTGSLPNGAGIYRTESDDLLAIVLGFDSDQLNIDDSYFS